MNGCRGMLHGCLIMERNGISLKRAGDRRKTHNDDECLSLSGFGGSPGAGPAG